MATNTTTTPDCTIQGNPDLIGLGVRLTFYLQTITTALAAAFLDQQFDYLQSSGITFFLAVLFVLIREVHGATDIRAPEAAVVFWMMYLLALALGNASRVRSRAYSREAVRQALLCCALIYGCWFWFEGIGRLPRGKDGNGEECEEYAFYLRKTELRGSYLKLNKILFPTLSVVFGCWCCWSVYKHVRNSLSSDRKLLSELRAAEPLAPILSDMRDKTKNSHWIVKVVVFMFSTGLVLGVSGILLVVTVPAIELQIKWNNIQGVKQLDSVGQLAPFLLSLGMLLHVLYSIVRNKDSFKDDWEKDKGKPIEDCPDRSPPAEQHELLERDKQI